MACHAQKYIEDFQTSMMEMFCDNGYQHLTVNCFRLKITILDVWQDSTSEIENRFLSFLPIPENWDSNGAIALSLLLVLSFLFWMSL